MNSKIRKTLKTVSSDAFEFTFELDWCGLSIAGMPTNWCIERILIKDSFCKFSWLCRVVCLLLRVVLGELPCYFVTFTHCSCSHVNTT